MPLLWPHWQVFEVEPLYLTDRLPRNTEDSTVGSEGSTNEDGVTGVIIRSSFPASVLHSEILQSEYTIHSVSVQSTQPLYPAESVPLELAIYDVSDPLPPHVYQITGGLLRS